MPSVGSISFPVPVAPTTVNAKVETRVVDAGAGVNGKIIEFWGDVQGGAIPQVNTLTVTAGATGNVYAVSVSTGLLSDPDIYNVVQEAGDTATILAARLARTLNDDPRVQATSAGAVVTATGVTAGQVITLNANPVTLTTTPANLVLALTTAASGTAVYRKLEDVLVVFGVNAAGNPTISLTPRFYGGDSSNTVMAGASVTERIHPKTIATIRTENNLS